MLTALHIFAQLPQNCGQVLLSVFLFQSWKHRKPAFVLINELSISFGNKSITWFMKNKAQYID